MLRISNDKERHVVVYSTDLESDKLVIKVLHGYFKNLIVVKDQFELLHQLDDSTPKVIFLSAETIGQALKAYYQILNQNPSEEFCEHKLVCLCSRHDEERAYNACISEAIDDYIISKPLYEVHRPVLVARHLLAELGIHYIQQSMYQTSVSKLDFSEELSELVSQGLKRKNDLKQHIQSSIENIERVLDKAKIELIASNKTSLNVDELRKVLAAIRSDEVRPELLRIQEKALTLLDGLIKPAEQLAKATMMGERATESRREEAKQHMVSEWQKMADDLIPPENFRAAPTPPKEAAKSQPPVNRLYGADNVDELVEQAKVAAANKKSAKLSVLLIDEDTISLNLSSRLLQSKRYELYQASSGHSAVSFIQNKEIDLVISELQVTDCDCINLADQLNRREGKKPKFVILSSNKSKDVLRRAAAAGVKMYLLKPLSKVSLDKVLEKCFGL